MKKYYKEPEFDIEKFCILSDNIVTTSNGIDSIADDGAEEDFPF